MLLLSVKATEFMIALVVSVVKRRKKRAGARQEVSFATTIPYAKIGSLRSFQGNFAMIII